MSRKKATGNREARVAAKKVATSQAFSLRVENTTDGNITFHLEPWGDIFRMAPGMTFIVKAEGPSQEGADCMVIEHGPGRITVWGWSGSAVEVFYRDRDISEMDISERHKHGLLAEEFYDQSKLAGLGKGRRKASTIKTGVISGVATRRSATNAHKTGTT